MASDRPQEELNLRFVICCVTCVTKKRSIKISGCKKCQSNLARAQFSHFSLPFPEDFTMDEDQKPTKLRDLEIDFLKEQLNGFSVEGDYCFGYFEGNKAEMDDLLVLFQALNSTCCVLTESHSKEKKLQQIFSNRYNILNQPSLKVELAFFPRTSQGLSALSRPGLEPGSSDSDPSALTTGLLNKAVALACPRYS